MVWELGGKVLEGLLKSISYGAVIKKAEGWEDTASIE